MDGFADVVERLATGPDVASCGGFENVATPPEYRSEAQRSQAASGIRWKTCGSSPLVAICFLRRFMDRRRFLQRTAVATAAAYLPGARPVGATEQIDLPAFNSTLIAATNVDVAGHTLICEFTMDSTKWKVYEDLRTREG